MTDSSTYSKLYNTRLSISSYSINYWYVYIDQKITFKYAMQTAKSQHKSTNVVHQRVPHQNCFYSCHHHATIIHSRIRIYIS